MIILVFDIDRSSPKHPGDAIRKQLKRGSLEDWKSGASRTFEITRPTPTPPPRLKANDVAYVKVANATQDLFMLPKTVNPLRRPAHHHTINSPWTSWQARLPVDDGPRQLQVLERQDPPRLPRQPRVIPFFTTTSEAYAHALYLGEVQDDDAATFLEKNEAYDTHKRQRSIPSKPTTRGDLVDTVFKIIQSVIGVFVRPTQQGVEREVVEMDRMPEVEQKDESTPEYTALVVRAAGPSFEAPPAAVSSSVGFGNIATYISVKLDSGLGDAAEILDEMVPYAWHIFREQPNRIHIRSLIITEKHARLVHFDRAGSQITPPIDIHEHPKTLVRLVAGLSSINERTLGLDDSIQWTIVAGRKSQGTLTTAGPSGERKTFPILEQIPIPRDWISGRATTCWRVQDPDTQEEFVVKDSWRPGDRVAEYELLELAKGVPGVVTAGKFLNRIATCLTMKCCGGLIESFKSTLQLLCALCDAIAGHQRLVGDDIRILHRDISPNNILLGRDDASEGDRGVLIDFDLAFKATAEHPVVVIDHNIGTRVFQSLSVVESFCIRMNKHQHDYLDDLESFLYVLTHIFLCFRSDASCVPSKDEDLLIISEWAAHDPETAASNKRCLFGFGGGLRHRIRGGREVLGSCVYLAV
ncbi:hypothetical protein FA13DRAFT_1798641 [Coprinellus micaceus]|uniref:Fungal-type protein kinase domain-containing protein n=1 Tax=Coprinellus micaceus TaxID=71717 RepID=A0A4Y7SLQ5_COPMI|nr:hypothetical protein FA13DRAFT_1798641 [Coprinellus micaceus]